VCAFCARLLKRTVNKKHSTKKNKTQQQQSHAFVCVFICELWSYKFVLENAPKFKAKQPQCSISNNNNNDNNNTIRQQQTQQKTRKEKKLQIAATIIQIQQLKCAFTVTAKKVNDTCQFVSLNQHKHHTQTRTHTDRRDTHTCMLNSLCSLFFIFLLCCLHTRAV